MSAILDHSATELVQRYRSGELSPVEVVEASLAHIDTDQTNSVITRCDEQALAAAQASAERYVRGEELPLDGVPLGIKDTIATKGVATSGADAIYEGWVPDADATIVERLREAGMVVVAKHSAYSFALGHTNTHHGPALNPWDPERTTGGSSSGAGAAVASRQVPVAIGSDTGGSIRLPASWCGVSGIKPTYGRIPTRGAMPLGWSFDTVGPLARTVDDLAAVLQASAGHDPRDSTSSRRPVGNYTDPQVTGVAGLRIGIPENWFLEVCDPHIARAVQDAADLLVADGAELVSVTLPHADLTQAVGWLAVLGEITSIHEITVDRLTEYDEAFGGHLLTSQFVSAGDYLRASRLRTVIQDDYQQAFEKADLLLIPGSVTYAPKFVDMLCQVGDREYPWLEVSARTTYSANITGVPGLSIPAGTGWNGLPLGIQFLGRPFDEATLLRVGRHYQQVTDHHLLAPPTQV